MKFRHVSIGALLLLGAIALHAQERSTPKPRGPVDAKPVAELPPAKIVSRQDLGQQTTLVRLANGMTVIIREHHIAPVATARVYVGNTGSAYEAEYLGAGISHLVEHLVSGGSTKNRTEKQIEELLNSLGASSNAYTSTDVTAYHVDTPAKHIQQVIGVLADAMQHCIFPEKEFAREYQVVQRELEMGNEERGRVMWNLLSQIAYREHPLRHPVIGYLPVLQRLTRDDVLRYYKERYQPQNMTLIVVGNVQTQAILDELPKHFGAFKRTVENNIVLPVEPPLTSPRRLGRAMEGELTDVTMAWPTVSIGSADVYALDVASAILGNGDSSRLSRKLRFEKNLVIGISCSSYTPLEAPGWFQAGFVVEPDKLAKAEAEVAQEVYRLRTEPVTAEELIKAKKQVIAADIFGHRSVEQIAESIASSYHDTGDPLFAAFYTKRIQAVTVEDIQRVARLHLVPERLMVAVIDPIGVKRATEVGLQQTDDDKIQRHVLPNGVIVLLKRNSAIPLVHMHCFAKGGLLGETNEQNGVSDLTAELMTRGTAKFTADQIAEFFDSNGGDIGVTGGRQSSYVSCNVLKEDFVPAFDYFVQVALHPTFPADEFRDRKQETLLAIGQRRASPMGEALEVYHDAIPKTSPHWRISSGRKDTVAKLTADDCRKFHLTHFVPKNLVVTIFGDIDPVKTLNMVHATFGTLTQTTDFRFPEFPDFRLDKPISVSKVTRRPDTVVILLSYPTVNLKQHKENDALLVLQSILSGYDSGSGWLFHDLRGAGLVYMVQASHHPSLATGTFTVSAQTRPDQLDEALARIKEFLSKAARGDITADEFGKVKQQIINAHARENETLAERARLAGVNEIIGLGFDFEDSFERRIEGISLDDVKTVAQRYLNNGIQVITGPK